MSPTPNPRPNPTLRHGQCHCGAVRFEAALDDDLRAVRRCNCSFCRMRGAVVAFAGGGVKILAGANMLTSYRFHSRKAEHFFCARCGVYTHHQRRSAPSAFAVNVACLDGVSPFDFTEVPVADGANHPDDTGQPSRLAGVLRFFPAEAPEGSG